MTLWSNLTLEHKIAAAKQSLDGPLAVVLGVDLVFGNECLQVTGDTGGL